MKIEYLDRDGVPTAEIDMHIEIEQVLDQCSFTKQWKGYASFQLDVAGQERDFDLVLLTEKIILCVELKNWHGSHLYSTKNEWFLDGNQRGRSPYHVITAKARVLHSSMKKFVRDLPVYPPIKSIVVLHGQIDQVDLAPQEIGNVVTKEEFLDLLTDPTKFAQHFETAQSRFPANIYLDSRIVNFFTGEAVKPRPWRSNGYDIDRTPVYIQQNHIYTEHLGKNGDNKTILLRLWNFEQNRFPLLHDEAIRKGIALREQHVYEYLHDRQNNLHYKLLQPIVNQSFFEKMRLDFEEVLGFGQRYPQRFVEYLENQLKRVMSFDDRHDVLHALIVQLKQFHDVEIHHNDLDPKNIWCNAAQDITFTGFYLSDIPSKSFTNAPEVACLNCPPEIPYGPQRDIYALGQLVKPILFARSDFNDLPESLRTKYEDFADKAANGRFFKSVDEMLSAFHEIRAYNENSALYSPKEFDHFVRSFDYIEDDYDREGDFLCRTRFLKKYRAIHFETKKRVWISQWRLNGGVEKQSNEQGAIVLGFLSRLENLKSANEGHILKIIDFGISAEESDRVYLVEESPDDLMEMHDWAAERYDDGDFSFEDIRSFCYSLLDAYQTYWDVTTCTEPFNEKSVYIRLDENLVASPVLILTHHLDLYGESSKQSCRSDNLRQLVSLLDKLSKLVDEQNDGLKNIRRLLSEYLTINLLPSDLVQLKQAFEPPVSTSPSLSLDPITIYKPFDNAQIVGAGPSNNDFTIKFQPHKKYTDACIAYICGKTFQLLIEITPSNKRVSLIGQSLVNPQSTKDAISFTCPMIRLKSDGVNAYEQLMNNPVLSAYIKTACSLAPNNEAKVEPKNLPEDSRLPIKTLWDKILSAEQAAIPSFTVLTYETLQISTEKTRNRQKTAWVFELTAPASLDRFDSDEDILAMREKNEGSWCVFGEVDRRECVDNRLVVLPNRRAKWPDLIQEIKLISRNDNASLSRRREALREIDSDATYIRHFSSYFEHDADIKPIEYEGVNNTPPAIVSYDHNQTEAFKKVLAHGPISLLQGPPGTGKTRFISGLLVHILSTMPYCRVLLTSQSNEAVNNAIEKTMDLCAKTGLTLNAIRIGHADKISENISWYFSENIKERYRKKLLMEQENRALLFAPKFGLPVEFGRQVYKLYASAWAKVEALPKDTYDLNEYANANQIANQAMKDWCSNNHIDLLLVSTLNARENFERVMNELTRTFSITSAYAVQKLRKLIELILELDTGLATDHSKYAAFSTKTKSIVAGTLVGLGAHNLKLEENTFDWVIVDEASRATASELAIVCRVAKRVLLVGDHKQLPPTYDEDVRKALKIELNTKQNVENLLISDFERIYQSSYGQAVGCSLNTQYRMDPVIGTMVSECFYDGRLNNGREARSLALASELPSSLQNSPVVWYDTSSIPNRGAEGDDGRGVIFNVDEAKAIVQLLRQIFMNNDHLLIHKDRNTSEPMVGVICMYRGQRRLLNELIQKEDILMIHRKNIKIDSVDSYQGKENQIIILSTVRSKTTGFLKSDKRINVAISRARDSLVIFGSARLWSRNANLPLGKVFKHITV